MIYNFGKMQFPKFFGIILAKTKAPNEKLFGLKENLVQ